MRNVKKEKGLWRSYVFSVVSFFLAAGIFYAAVQSVSGKASDEGEQTLKDAIKRASVQCYAIEGRYPPSIAYLEENYGIQIDRDRYYVFYQGFASNIMPEITVNPVLEK